MLGATERLLGDFFSCQNSNGTAQEDKRTKAATNAK
jgi:hypothetical protein